MIMYKLVKNHDGSEANIIIRILDNAGIPKDFNNTDFVKYQKWLDAGNNPLPADE